jgi:hypothetical protein
MATRAALRRALSAVAAAQRSGALAATRAHASLPLFAPLPAWHLLQEGAHARCAGLCAAPCARVASARAASVIRVRTCDD